MGILIVWFLCVKVVVGCDILFIFFLVFWSFVDFVWGVVIGGLVWLGSGLLELFGLFELELIFDKVLLLWYCLRLLVWIIMGFEFLVCFIWYKIFESFFVMIYGLVYFLVNFCFVFLIIFGWLWCIKFLIL